MDQLFAGRAHAPSSDQSTLLDYGTRERGSVDLELHASMTWRLEEYGKRLALHLPPEALTKTGVNGLIEALKKIREGMVR